MKNRKTSRPRPPKPEPQLLTPENCLDDLSFDLTHDEFFKQTFAMIPFAKAFLRMVLNAMLLMKLELDKLTVVDPNYFDEQFKKYHADIVYRIPLRGGGEVFIHIIIEHKSGETDFETILQLSNYVMQIHKGEARLIKNWNRDTRLQPVIAIIVHHGSLAFMGATELSELIQKLDGAEEYQMWMRAILLDLSQKSAEDIPHDDDCPEFWPILMIMKTVFSKKDVLGHFDEIMAELKPFLDNPHYLYLIRLCVHYVVSSNARYLEDEDMLKIDETIHNTLGENMPSFINSYWKSGVAEGRAEGEARGRSEGVAIGEARGRAIERRRQLIAVILTSLRKNCHVVHVPADIEDELNNRQDIFVLESLFEDSFDCTSLDEFRQKL